MDKPGNLKKIKSWAGLQGITGGGVVALAWGWGWGMFLATAVPYKLHTIRSLWISRY